MDDIFYRRPYGGAAGMSEGFGYGRETNSYGGSSKLQFSRVSPSLEDYGDIFGSFHGSRASSIPTINIPAVEEAEVFFDAGTSESEYGEVFGEFDVLDFEMPHEALIDQPKGGDDDSVKEYWSPVGSEHPLGDSGTYDQPLGCCEGGKMQDIKASLQVADNNNSKQDIGIEMGNESDHQTQNDVSSEASASATSVEK